MQEEQYTLPEDVLKSRVGFFYTFGFWGGTTELFWRLQGKQRAEKEEKFIGKAKGVRRAVTRVISPNDPPEIKLRKLYARAQQVRNLGYERPRTEKEKKRGALKDNKSVEDVLKRGYGSPWDINRLLVALARAAGFDAAVVMLAAGDNRIFRKNLPDFGQLNAHVVQVRLGAKEVFLDPATLHCPFGFLSWGQAGVLGLRLEKDGGVFVKTPELVSADVVTERKATLQLDAAGTLQGTVAVVFRRQKALWRRLAAINEDEVGRREKLEEEVKGWLPEGATVELENVTGWEGSEEPLRAEFSVEIPNFTVTTGRRLLLPLGLFQVNEKHLFQHAKRVHSVYFGYPWQEKDEVTVQLPAGYQAGISVLPAPDGTFIHPIAADRTKTSIVAQSFSFKGLHLSPRRRATDWNPCFSGISQTPLHTCAPCHRRAGFVALQAARQPAGTGSAQILRSMSPNSRRVRCPSASRSQ